MAYWWVISFGSFIPVFFFVLLIRVVTEGLRDGFRRS